MSPSTFCGSMALTCAPCRSAKRLRSILPTDSAFVFEALSVVGRGRQFFDLTLAHDLEGIVAKRLNDPYAPHVRWLKIKNSAYSQQEGRRELFDRQRPSHSHRGSQTR